MLEIFRLIRLRTIAFTAFTMYAMRFLVILPLLDKEGVDLQMPEGDFSLLVIAVCCLVSAAYVINDYFDTKADRISGSRPVIVGKTISRRAAITLHTLLNMVAVGIAYYLARNVHHSEIVFLFLVISAILWFYSSRFKKRFLWGNLIVAFLAGLIPLTVATFEIPLLNEAYSDVIVKTQMDFNNVFYWTSCFAYFLFLNMLIYEINKDMYSVNGDRAEGIMTIPVKCGIPVARKVIITLVAVCLISLVVFFIMEFRSSAVMLVYFLIGLIVPYLVYGYSVLKNDKMKFQLRLIRLIMALCIGISLFLHHFFNCQA
ncbi:geranylgeranylglycerol-phosphate geranylgeranyltransferase [Butyricimonas synergistica]|uniref:geranylgeranylglycerol-phosphate geranylgeranyltransferase n=1 Tax=Butyricimonas synergistica TaxID=544644 RepID=UPI00035D8263|nr:geranylgeranylglycerol-phosphate geranylgeranyltransferase [Butyricimonas synergistica]